MLLNRVSEIQGQDHLLVGAMLESSTYGLPAFSGSLRGHKSRHVYCCIDTHELI
jgi:hypothetical protein